MKKIFGKKPQIRPTPLPPPNDADAPPTTPTLTQAAQMLHSTTKNLPKLPNNNTRPTAEAAFQSQAPPPTQGRSSFQQQQRTPRQPSSRSTSGDDVQTAQDNTQRSHDSAWIVVDPIQTVQSQPQSHQNSNGSDYRLMIATPTTAPAFESRSSLASLPPGASPPLTYPESTAPGLPPPSSPFAAVQQSPLPPPTTVSRRSDAADRRRSNSHNGIGGLFGTHGHRHSAMNGEPFTASNEQLYEALEVASVGPEKDRRGYHEKDKPWKGIFNWGDRDKQRAQAEQISPFVTTPPAAPDLNNGPKWDITRTVGYVTATGSEDWTLLLDVCERASTDSGAKEAAKALRNEFKYAEPGPMLSAARLWAIMLRNCQTPFIQQSCSRKFIDTVEETVYDPKTSPVVRERLLVIIAGAAYQYGDQFPAFRALWRKVKSKSAPPSGIAFDPSDAMFAPPARRLPKPSSLHDGTNGGRPSSIVNVNVNVVTGPISPPDGQPISGQRYPEDQSFQQTLTLPPLRTDSRENWSSDEQRNTSRRESLRKIQGRPPPPPPPITTKSSARGIIPPEEDIRRLFEECELARGNAQMLANTLVYARPDDVLNGVGVTSEFHTQCLRSKDIIETQIPWATSGAERSRAEQQRRDPSGQTVTTEEELLASLLQANSELTEVLREYQEVLNMGAAEREERAVRERSRKETRLDPRNIQIYGSDGSFMSTPQGQGLAGGSSRSSSPSMLSSGPRSQHPLPTPPSALSSTVALNSPGISLHSPQLSISATQNGSANTLAPPPHAPLGPRQPSRNGSRSRSPSPDGARRSSEGLKPPGGLLNSSLERATTGGKTMESFKRGISKLGIDVHRAKSLSRGDKGRKSSEKDRSREREVPRGSATPEEREGVDEDVVRTPVQPSSKALGKRRAGPYAEDESFDPDDLFNQRPGTPAGLDEGFNPSDSDSLLDDLGHPHAKPRPVVYAYDAAAEREKDRQRQLEAMPTSAVH